MGKRKSNKLDYNPFTEKQLIFIRKMFLIEEVQEMFNKWLDENFIYCESSHSFVHRCFNSFKKCKNHREAKQFAWHILDQMRLEFLYITFDKEWLKNKVKEIKYELPLDRLKRLAKLKCQTKSLKLLCVQPKRLNKRK